MLIYKENLIETDTLGYLKNSREWNEDIAILLAKQEKIQLTEEHWEIIRLIRQFYQEFNTSPAIRMLVKAMTKAFGEQKSSSQYLYRLFPQGPAKQATKIAGLPKPVKCI